MYWEEFDKLAVNPITEQEVIASRKRISHDLELPMKDAYREFIQKIIFTS